MFKNKKICVIISIFIVLSIVITFFLIKKVNKENSKSNTTIEHNTTLTDEERKDVISEIKNELQNKKNETILIVGEKEISEKEVAFINFQINNKYVNQEQNIEDAVNETIRQYVILQNAEQSNITLTTEENESIENKINKYVNEDEEETNEILEAFNMTYNEFLEFYIDRTKKLEIISKWERSVIDKINSGNIDIESEEFNNKYIEFVKSDDTSKRYTLLLELLELYENYLIEQTNIEYVNQ